MIVTCEKCMTIFELDETRIKGAAAKVRCSRCQHVFEVAKESAVEEPDLSGYLEGENETALEVAPETASSETLAEEAEEPDLSSYLQDETETLPEVRTSSLEPELPARSSLTPALRWRRGLWLSLGGLVLLMALGGGWWYMQRYSVKTSPAAQTPSPAPSKTAARPAVNLPASDPAPAAHPDKELKMINIVDYGVLYNDLKNLKGERLIVIGGKVKNDGVQPRWPIRLQAALIDSDQKPVIERVFYCGTTLSAAELRDLAPEQINKWLDTPGGRPPAQPVAPPGKTIPFTVVFFGAPKTVTGYNLAVISAPVGPSVQSQP